MELVSNNYIDEASMVVKTISALFRSPRVKQEACTDVLYARCKQSTWELKSCLDDRHVAAARLVACKAL